MLSSLFATVRSLRCRKFPRGSLSGATTYRVWSAILLLIISVWQLSAQAQEAGPVEPAESPPAASPTPTPKAESPEGSAPKSKGRSQSPDKPNVPEKSAPINADAAQIETWLQMLNSDVFGERQTAMMNLKRSGTAGVAALTRVARGGSLEVTVRAISLLTQMYESPDPEVSIAADDALESLAQSGPPVAVVRTKEVLTTVLSEKRRQHAITAIRRLGGHVIPKVEQDDVGEDIEANLDDEDSIQHVVLGKKWKGGVDGLKYLQRLPELRFRVLYITTDISLNADELGILKEKMAGVRIETRGSAYLGITSLIQAQDPDICLIHTVVPNSPAKQAGLRPGDLITHVDGLPIHGFAELTANLSLKRGGDAVYLEVLRGDEPLEVVARLGEW